MPAPCRRHDLRGAYLLSEGFTPRKSLFYPKGVAVGGIKFHLFQSSTPLQVARLILRAKAHVSRCPRARSSRTNAIDSSFPELRARQRLRVSGYKKKGGLAVAGRLIGKELTKGSHYVISRCTLRCRHCRISDPSRLLLYSSTWCVASLLCLPALP